MDDFSRRAPPWISRLAACAWEQISEPSTFSTSSTPQGIPARLLKSSTWPDTCDCGIKIGDPEKYILDSFYIVFHHFSSSLKAYTFNPWSRLITVIFYFMSLFPCAWSRNTSRWSFEYTSFLRSALTLSYKPLIRSSSLKIVQPKNRSAQQNLDNQSELFSLSLIFESSIFVKSHTFILSCSSISFNESR